MDPDTAHPELCLSEDCTEATYVEHPPPVPDRPSRFDYWEEVLCSRGLEGRCYWELEWRGQQVCIAVSYKGVGFIMLLLCPAQLRAQLGTTPNIKHIVVGRCYNYITLVNPNLRCRYDCEDIWRQFEEAVVRQTSCNVTAEDYHQMFYAMPQTWPCDTFLFWSKTRTLMHSYAAVVRDFWTLEDTLVGYMFNDLIWCGQEGDSEMACGNVTVLLNGSIANAFNRKRESCNQGSIVDLIQILQSRGFRWTCTDNDQTLMILQCIRNPKQSACQTCANGLSHRRSLTFN
ncbi:ADP-ribosyl cyclase/cyclic ADP-ribose hydrolase 1 [Nibea albiflora]|uniref:ADP-ribosyl cyclase/cyclic ADP-ribose hydrolase 1 n=1 Tax=Nibea albiflora TaxID=240163 RepID=A0ACB7F5Z0_NIBAL|nr:ADP-ribosyl cyclase/cyclic ADP-ribose hydrolase 1 [Nibea albiflora]